MLGVAVQKKDKINTMPFFWLGDGKQKKRKIKNGRGKVKKKKIGLFGALFAGWHVSAVQCQKKRENRENREKHTSVWGFVCRLRHIGRRPPVVSSSLFIVRNTLATLWQHTRTYRSSSSGRALLSVHHFQLLFVLFLLSFYILLYYIYIYIYYRRICI